MRDENRANELTKEIGQLILQDPKLAHGTWNAFSLVVLMNQDKHLNYGFFYDIKGKAAPFTTDIPDHLLQELQECLVDNGQHWRACQLEVKAANWEMNWDFEYESPERFLPSSNVQELANFMCPKFEQDQFWHCPLSHNIISTLKVDSPQIVEDLKEDNLHCMITNSLLKGMRHGLRTSSDLASFALACFDVAPNFDAHPAMRAAFLKVKDIPGPVWNILCAAVSEDAWKQMSSEEFYDGRAWFSEMRQERAEEVA